MKLHSYSLGVNDAFVNNNLLSHYSQPMPALALHEAIKKDSYKGCEAIISAISKEEVLIPNIEEGATALHLAVLKDSYDYDLAELLINKNPTIVTCRDKHGQTALHLAACKGKNEICQLILNEMNDEDALTEDFDKHYTALHLAVQGGHVETVKVLLGKSKELSKQLAAIQDKYGQTPLHWAASKGDKEICHLLVNVDEEIVKVQTFESKYTALHLAIHGGHTPIVKILLGKNKTLSKELAASKDAYGQTALHWAASKGNSEACQLLLEQMDDEEILLQTLDTKYTALHLATQGKHIGIIQLLLNKSPELAKKLAGCRDKRGQTALHWAAGKGDSKACQLLLNTMDNNQIALKSSDRNQTALELAVAAQHYAVQDLFHRPSH